MNSIQYILDNEAKFLAVFPELKELLINYNKAVDAPGCTSCAKKNSGKALLRELLALPERKGSNILNGLTTAEREGCLDCVCKHLSQAWVLMDEVVQGYPDYISLAIDRVDDAIACADIHNKSIITKLNSAKQVLQSIDLTTERNLEFHLRRADELLTSIFEANNRHPLTVWKAIGHLGEAADECIEDRPRLATKIREERLILMATPNYRPPVAMLLNEARI